MRSRSTPPSQNVPTKQRRAARATPQMAAGAPTTGRRSRRAQPAAAGAAVAGGLADVAPSMSPAMLAVLAPEELYRREKARRSRPVVDDVMVEAKRILDEMLAESSRRGGTVKGGRRPARPAKPASSDPLDAMDLDQFTGLDADEKKDGEDE